MNDSERKWIEAGYKLFAAEGPGGIHVEKLARELRCNKSGFYHYFGDYATFLEVLFEKHRFEMRKVSQEIAGITRFDPDYTHILLSHREQVFFQTHLLRNNHLKPFNAVFENAVKRNDNELIPHLATYLRIPEKQALAQDLWGITRESFYISLTPERYTREFVLTYYDRLRAIVDKMVQAKNNGNSLIIKSV